MADQSILVSWIGITDLQAMCDDLGEEGDILRKTANITGKCREQPGPLKTAVTVGKFNQVHLLSNFNKTIHNRFAKWLGCNPVIHPVELVDPTDYDGIFRCTNRFLTEVSKITARSQAKLCILLSPGTPAMAVVWVLLGKSRYPASFYKTFHGKLTEEKIPEDLFEEIVPDLLRDRDNHLQHFASRNPSEVEVLKVLKARARQSVLLWDGLKKPPFAMFPFCFSAKVAQARNCLPKAFIRQAAERINPSRPLTVQRSPKICLNRSYLVM